jgi:hypothetical protein
MPDPFRQLATTPTAAALAKLDAMPTDPLRFVCALLAAYRAIPDAEANGSWREAARKQNMTYVGAASEGYTGQLHKQVFVDEAGTTQAHISVRFYFFATYFESGKCVLTFAFIPATQGTDDLVVISGGGNFSRDYASHTEMVAQHVDAGEISIVVRDIETAVALGRFYYRHVIATKTAAKVVVVHPMFILFVFLMFIIARFFR